MQLRNGKNINPLANYVFVEVIEDNPYIDKATDSGLILPGTSMHLSQETGEMEKLEQIICFGKITAAGPGCISLQIGDEVFFDKRGARVLPILGGGFKHINEQNIMSYIR